jgi:hypothetical protein
MSLTLDLDNIPGYNDEQNQDNNSIEKNMINLIEEYFPEDIIIFKKENIKDYAFKIYNILIDKKDKFNKIYNFLLDNNNIKPSRNKKSEDSRELFIGEDPKKFKIKDKKFFKDIPNKHFYKQYIFTDNVTFLSILREFEKFSL